MYHTPGCFHVGMLIVPQRRSNDVLETKFLPGATQQMTHSNADSPIDLLSKPMAVIGAGTLGRRIALMLATQGGEVRIFGGRPERRQEAKSFVEQRLPDVLK